jgi:hypothetical protein
MIITRNPAQTLELCYVAQKLRPSNIDEPKTDYKPSMGERWAITYDADKQRIVSIPPQRHDTTETKRSRATTTGRVATWIIQGRILAAAEKQIQVRADFLRFLYDPECSPRVRRDVSAWAKERLLLLIPHDEKNAGKRRRVEQGQLHDALLLHFSQMIRGGGERYTETQLANYLGYASMAEANWAKVWRRHCVTFLLQLQDFEGVAMAPVVRVIGHIFADKAGEVAMVYHDSGPAPQAALEAKKTAPRHSSTLTLRRGA